MCGAPLSADLKDSPDGGTGLLLRCQFNGFPERCQIPVLLPESCCGPFGGVPATRSPSIVIQPIYLF